MDKYKENRPLLLLVLWSIIFFICAQVDWGIQVPDFEKLVFLNANYPLLRKGLLGLLDILSNVLKLDTLAALPWLMILRALDEHDMLRLQEDNCSAKQSRIWESYILLEHLRKCTVMTQSQFILLKLKKNVMRSFPKPFQDYKNITIDLVLRRQLLLEVDDEIIEILLSSFGIIRKLNSSWGIIVKVHKQFRRSETYWCMLSFYCCHLVWGSATVSPLLPSCWSLFVLYWMLILSSESFMSKGYVAKRSEPIHIHLFIFELATESRFRSFRKGLQILNTPPLTIQSPFPQQHLSLILCPILILRQHTFQSFIKPFITVSNLSFLWFSAASSVSHLCKHSSLIPLPLNIHSTQFLRQQSERLAFLLQLNLNQRGWSRRPLLFRFETPSHLYHSALFNSSREVGFFFQSVLFPFQY